MPRKSVDILRQELLDSLDIIEREISHLESFPLSWQSIAIQLCKILCDKKPLLSRVISNPLFHPMLHPIEPNIYLMAMGFKTELSMTSDKSSVTLCYCFDDSKPLIPLLQWLDQIILVVDGQDLTIGDIVKFPRNKEAAHSDPKEHAKIEALKKAFIVRLGDKQYSSYHLSIATIAAYVVTTIRTMLSV